MAKKKPKQVYVDELTNEFRNTKRNEVFNVEMSTTPQTIKAGKGKDTLYLKGVSSLDELTFTKNGRDLEITRVVNGEKQKIIVERYFTSTTGKATKSSIKNIKIDVPNSLGNLDDPITRDYNIITESLIDYDGTFKRAKSGLIKGTVFNDKIIGSSKADKIKANSGDDIVYGAAGNDKLYGGKGADTFVFDTYSKENPITGVVEYFGAGADKIYDATNIDTIQFTTSTVYDLKFSRTKNNLVIKYFDVNDENKETTENTVTLVNYYKKKTENRLTKIVALNKWNALEEYTVSVLYDSDNPDVCLTAETDTPTVGEAEYNEEQQKTDFEENLIDNYNQKVQELENANQIIAEKNTEIDNLNGEIGRKETEISSLEQDKANLQDDIDELNSQISEKEQELANAQADYESAQADYERANAA